MCSVTRRWRSRQIQQTIVSALVLVKLDLRLMSKASDYILLGLHMGVRGGTAGAGV